MLPEISQALAAFSAATEELNVDADVTTFSISDFSRTLSQNGSNGSDHAWRANHYVMGGGVDGGTVYGNYPETLAAGNPFDFGRGRLIPTTAVDQYAAELALWFGKQNDAAKFPQLLRVRLIGCTSGLHGVAKFRSRLLVSWIELCRPPVIGLANNLSLPQIDRWW